MHAACHDRGAVPKPARPGIRGIVRFARKQHKKSHDRGLVAARPRRDVPPVGARGLLRPGLGARRDGRVLVPPTYQPGVPIGLLVVFHPAGSDAESAIAAVRELPEARDLVVAAPDSRGSAWDRDQGGFGADVAYLDSLLEWIFARYAIREETVLAAGLGDGASYAATLARANGALFRGVLSLATAPPPSIPRTDSVRPEEAPIPLRPRALPAVHHESAPIPSTPIAEALRRA